MAFRPRTPDDASATVGAATRGRCSRAGPETQTIVEARRSVCQRQRSACADRAPPRRRFAPPEAMHPCSREAAPRGAPGSASRCPFLRPKPQADSASASLIPSPASPRGRHRPASPPPLFSLPRSPALLGRAHTLEETRQALDLEARRRAMSADSDRERPESDGRASIGARCESSHDGLPPPGAERWCARRERGRVVARRWALGVPSIGWAATGRLG